MHDQTLAYEGMHIKTEVAIEGGVGGDARPIV